ncbi:MAG TPA: response regulator [Vicinamibacterales bacterium]|nr:response regulator [Vicinamibacterales bacterium]
METCPVRSRVLVVDDDRLMRWSLHETLAGHGCQVLEASDARAAFQAIADSTIEPDVVLWDVHLPDSHDLELLSTIHEHSPVPKIVVMSSFMNADIDREARARGAFDVLTKPFEIEAVMDVIARASH